MVNIREYGDVIVLRVSDIDKERAVIGLNGDIKDGECELHQFYGMPLSSYEDKQKFWMFFQDMCMTWDVKVFKAYTSELMATVYGKHYGFVRTGGVSYLEGQELQHLEYRVRTKE
jgi:hypothetical protein